MLLMTGVRSSDAVPTRLRLGKMSAIVLFDGIVTVQTSSCPTIQIVSRNVNMHEPARD